MYDYKIGQKIGQRARPKTGRDISWLMTVIDRPSAGQTDRDFQLRYTSAAVTESSSGGCGPMPLNAAECGNEIQSVQRITA
jgi:hypothetical protein